MIKSRKLKTEPSDFFVGSPLFEVNVFTPLFRSFLRKKRKKDPSEVKKMTFITMYGNTF